NEKVDIFPWSPNIRDLVKEALRPAKLKAIEVDEAAKKVKVMVDEENLSLAIGRRGQNARLTQKLTGWEIDVQKEQSAAMGFEEKLHKAAEALAAALQTDAATAAQVVRAGFLSVDGITEVEEDEFLAALPDLDKATAKHLREAALAHANTTKS